MRLITLAAFASLLTISAAHADTMKNCAAAWKAKSADAVAAKTYKAWSTICLKADYHVSLAANMTGPLPEDATAQCKDGTYTTVKVASGRCSHHGGVARVRQ
ncbi:MAG TPA: DUF3761 domain-containing protein [Rhizomicrobium sp.]|jgi:hypothetical protein|nr:DUF3761 domain-containing protein [Rhizomicrobium sp.]